MLDREKKVERYSLVFVEGVRVNILSSSHYLGYVITDGCGVRVALNHTSIPMYVAQAAAEFLKECLAEQEQEKLSTLKCEVEYTFTLTGDGSQVRVSVNHLRVGSVWQDGSSVTLLPEVIAAARKFAGWA